MKVRVLPDGRLSRKDAAKYLGRAEKTLAMWEMVGHPAKLLSFCLSSQGLQSRRPVALAAHQDAPDNTGVLIGQRHRCDLGRFTGYNVGKPWQV